MGGGATLPLVRIVRTEVRPAPVRGCSGERAEYLECGHVNYVADFEKQAKRRRCWRCHHGWPVVDEVGVEEA